MKHILLTLAILLPGVSLPATVLSPEEAWNRAASGDGTETMRKGARQGGDAKHTLLYTAEGTTGAAVYVFDLNREGFLLLSADELAAPVLGFSDSGRFDATDIPCGLQTWLDMYARQIDAAREVGLQSTRSGETAVTEREPLPIALTTKWAQDAPYYNMCPMMGGKERCVTGCVATAMAQLVNLRRFSTHGSGKNSYIWKYGYNYEGYAEELSFDFSAVDFDWANMLDDYSGDYTEEEGKAVAELMYACGVAVNMGYSNYASSTPDTFVPYGLWQYFGYNAGIQCILRDCYSEREGSWEDLVYEEVKKHGAVLYNGATAKNEGHAFVCDGYDKDGYFHFNWGWAGMSDGWYRLDALNPAQQGTGGSSTNRAFNYGQSIQAFVDPGAEDERFIPCICGLNDRFNISNKSVKKGAKFTVTGSLANLTQLDYDVTFGVLLTDSPTGTEGRAIEVVEFKLHAEEQKRIMSKAVFPEDVADGVYCVRPVGRWEGLDDWYILPWNLEKDCVWIEVKGETVEFNVDPAVSGISPVDSDFMEAAVYYDLQGQRVDVPAKGGLYIRVEAGKAVKEIY